MTPSPSTYRSLIVMNDDDVLINLRPKSKIELLPISGKCDIELRHRENQTHFLFFTNCATLLNNLPNDLKETRE